MKQYILITALILAASISAMAQMPNQKHLPAVITIKLTERQLLKLDTAINIAISGTDSKRISQFYNDAYAPIFEQSKNQMIADSVKVKTPVKKPKF